MTMDFDAAVAAMHDLAGPATIRAALMVARSRGLGFDDLDASGPMRRPPEGLVPGGAPHPRRARPRPHDPRGRTARGKRP
ncbi:hypothetical protein [Lichenibacterium dinghuense]|uniref:hypothetical protein n=1 Tax=Lichenibacterium dinghuense TaxID=2895977 RepID=UPI001F35DA29|nr:hypothetical protein [Lichenibacterium sp. 6Y81]